MQFIPSIPSIRLSPFHQTQLRPLRAAFPYHPPLECQFAHESLFPLLPIPSRFTATNLQRAFLHFTLLELVFFLL